MKRAPYLAFVLAGLSACRFPSFTYEAAGGDGGGPADGATDAWSGNADGESSSSSGGPDAADDLPLDTGTADGASSSGGEETGDPCDEDGDGYKNASCDGGDCCDTDKQANPGQKSFFASKDACGNFDWNCDSKEEPEYGANLHCGYLLGVGCIPTCTGMACTTGFLGPDPGCGASAPYGECESNIVGICNAQAIPTQPTQTQACR